MKIGKYRIIGLLGKGGMGRVYKAELPEINKVTALKLLRPHEHMLSLLGSEAVEEMFMTEARILGRLRHPNVASILDFDRDQSGRPFFVMEYHCMNLGTMIGEHYVIENPTRIVEPARTYRYARQVLAGLDRLHHAGILHRDIKPYNVLITETDEARIIDFGLSLLRGESSIMPESFKIGTPYYTAPEQEKAPDRVDARADIFGAGVLIWRMLTGCLPPESEQRPRPGGLNSLLGGWWDDFLLKAVSPEPETRFSDCMQMMHAMDEAYQKWHENLELECRMQVPEEKQSETRLGKQRLLRKTPRKVPLNQSRDIFGLDEQWRPVGFLKGEFSETQQGIVTDSVNCLVWEKSGTPYPVDWQEAKEYIEFLNTEGFAGIQNWRLPTVDELTAQIRQASVLGDYCAPSVFDRNMRRLWSSDRKSYTSAWFVDTDLGYVGAADFTCLCHVRAVSDDQRRTSFSGLQ